MTVCYYSSNIIMSLRILFLINLIIPLQSSRHEENTPNDYLKMEGAYLLPKNTPMPMDKMTKILVPENKNICTFCQYLLYYLQIELSDQRKEAYIRESVMQACEKLPSVANEECKQFVSEYEPAVIALLAQEVDPSTEYIRESVMGACEKLPRVATGECKQFLCQYGSTVVLLLIQEVKPSAVCPSLGVCPSEKLGLSTKMTSKSSCPLCLFAVEQLETVLRDNKTEDNIRLALSHLCQLFTNIKMSCTQFVDVNSNALTEMLLADLNAQEICVYLKLCKEKDATITDSLQLLPVQATYVVKKPNTVSIDKYMENLATRDDFNNAEKSSKPRMTSPMATASGIERNKAPVATNAAIVKQGSQKTVCVVCEFVMKEVDDQLEKHSEDDNKLVDRDSICKRMPKNVRSDCDQFIEKYAELLVILLIQKVDPSQVCEKLKLCPSSQNTVITNKGIIKAEEMLDCAVCETIVLAVKKVIKKVDVDTNIVQIIEKSCALLPSKYSKRCHTMMKIYGDSVIHLIEEYGSKQVCLKIGICSSDHTATVNGWHPNIKQESTTLS